MTREEAIIRLKEGEPFSEIYDAAWNEALEMAIKALEQEAKTSWIPVSERLPEEKLAVLVWCPEYKNMYCAYLENKNWWIFGAFSQIIPNAVIAWMPLPEPYKAEGSKE